MGALYNWAPKTNGLVVMDNGLNLVNALLSRKHSHHYGVQAGYPSTLVRFNKNNFQPRIGFAYKPFEATRR